MFPDLEIIHRPGKLEDALRLLAEQRGQRAPLAGGTALGIWRRRGVTEAVDLWGLPLNLIEETRSTVRIGATVTVQDLLASPVDDLWDGALSETAGAVASTPVRNLITLGGNLCAAFPWADLPVLLLALDARILLGGWEEEERWISMDDWLAAAPQHHLEGRRLLLAVQLATPRPGEGAAFETLTQVKFDYALASAAVALGVQDGRVAWARVAVGALEGRPRRLPEAEEVLREAAAHAETWSAAGRAASGAVQPVQDPRVEDGYRREVIGVLVERALARAARRAEGGGS